MASTSSLASFSFSSSPFTGSKIWTDQPRTLPFRASVRPFSVSASCASTSERLPSLYDVLGIQMDATSNGQKKDTAYEFIRAREAYETLSDPDKRADYDRSFFRPGRQMSSPFVMPATTMETNFVAAGFPAYSKRRWETDQCW
ncbi:hypothetical protein OIU84_013817 [Salix udensis]|uniref:Chaperone DnaJ-domain superfamily protein n=1 Tax=Salix udensis TaxID=889485 RepID=A0AAD6JK55_9ROSI|nr:hypothetical protein OIU84_013817 [Salix udensis]